MFTGIVEELGHIGNITLLPQSAQLTIQAAKVLPGTQIGDSIAVNGVCLTVVEKDDRQFTVDIMAETLTKTDLSDLKRGSPVNLERALQLQTRLGGHLVSGHIDGIGRISRITLWGIAKIYLIETEPVLLRYIVPKGSIAVDGLSLTVVEVEENNFSVSLLPHTLKETTLGRKGIGSTLNLETDLIGKYVAKLLQTGSGEKKKMGKKQSDLSLDFLSEHGFL